MKGQVRSNLILHLKYWGIVVGLGIGDDYSKQECGIQNVFLGLGI